MRRTAVLIGVCLLFGLLAGLVLRPDDGTQVTISPAAESGAAVSGANHAKPLPRVPTPDVDLVRQLLALSIVALAALAVFPLPAPAVREDDGLRPRGVVLARTGARRGPPARV